MTKLTHLQILLVKSENDSMPSVYLFVTKDEAVQQAAVSARDFLRDYYEDSDDLQHDFDRTLTIERADSLRGDGLDAIAALNDVEAIDMATQWVGMRYEISGGTLPAPDPVEALKAIDLTLAHGGEASAAALLETGAALARNVVARWENGDLASAVNGLEEWADDVVAATPGLDHSDLDDEEED